MSSYQVKNVFVKESEFAKTGAAWMAERIKTAIKERGSCVFGVSGGSTPGPIYEELGKTTGIDWNVVTVFAVDERHIDPNNKDSIQYLIRTTLLENAKIPESQLILPNNLIPVEETVADYGRRIEALVASHPIDFVTLGLGPDGHFASLFPPVSEEHLNTQEPTLHTTTSKFAVFDRITTTPRILKLAKEYVFLLKGADKVSFWNLMMANPHKPQDWPAQTVLETGRATLIIGQ